jgi:FAD-linked sulfhydryl oxidase
MWNTLCSFLFLPIFGARAASEPFNFSGFREKLIHEISNTQTNEALLDTLTVSLSKMRQHLGHPEVATCASIPSAEPEKETEDLLADSLLTQIGDFVYDLQKFKHPGGALDLKKGEDLTPRFLAAHQGEFSLLERQDVRLVEPIQVEIAGKFYDLTRFAHPGGPLVVAHGENMTARFHKAHGNEFERLQRRDIREVDPTTELKKKRPVGKTEPQYGGNGGVWREWVGRRSWFLIHSMAAKYPDNPTEDDKQAMRHFVASLGQLYPCKLCRKHLQQQLRDPALGPVRVNSRTNLTTWMCELHNIVNKDIGKPMFDCTPFHLDLIYLKDCGECEHTSVSAPIDPKTQSGYHPTSGTWDAGLYGRNPELLQYLTDPAGVWEGRALDDLVEALMTLNSWFGVLDEDELRLIKYDLRLPEKRREWTRHFNDQLKPVLKPLIRDSEDEE